MGARVFRHSYYKESILDPKFIRRRTNEQRNRDYRKNKEKIREKGRNYYANNIVKIEIYRNTHKEKMKEYQKQYRAAHKEESAAYRKKYYA